MSFNERLQKAIQRGRRRNDSLAREEEARQLSEQECKSLHSKFRLKLSEHIEECMQRLPQHFPGFRFETIFGERGWGAACSRDDLQLQRGKRTNLFSRLEMTVRPYSSLKVIDLAAKGTVNNQELFSRNYFEPLPDIDEAKFLELIDAWVLEFAELFAAKS